MQLIKHLSRQACNLSTIFLMKFEFLKCVQIDVELKV